MRLSILFLSWVLLASSCSAPAERTARALLTGAAGKHWVHVMPYPIKKYHGVAFHPNGTATEYFIREDGRRIVNDSKYLWTYRLEMQGDSMLNYQGVAYRIEHLSEDMLVLNHANRGGIRVYLKAQDQATEARYLTAAEKKAESGGIEDL
jgi:hypothetical protein